MANMNKINVVSTRQEDGTNTSPSKALLLEGDQGEGRKEIGIPMTEVNNLVKEIRPMVYSLGADFTRVRLK